MTCRWSLLLTFGLFTFWSVGALEARVSAKEAGLSRVKNAPNLPDLSNIYTQLEGFRNLSFKKKVPNRFQTKEEMRASLVKDLEEEFPVEEREALVRGLMKLGLLQKKLDLGEGYIDAIVSQAAAYYDPETEHFYYIHFDNPESVRSVAAHELVHALQDQHFSLDKIFGELETMYEKTGIRDDDKILAIRSLIEGEAMYIQMLWESLYQKGQDLSKKPQMLNMMVTSLSGMDYDSMIRVSRMLARKKTKGGQALESMKAMENFPRYIMSPLMAAYNKGAFFIHKAHKNGGTDTVNKLFKAGLKDPENGIESSEQILHPEKFFSKNRDRPTDVTFPASTALTSAGWTTLDATIHGEFYLGLLFREHGYPAMEVMKATFGWDGDCYRAYAKEDQTAVSLMTTWDTAKDAREFCSLYLKLLNKKYPKMKRLASPDTLLDEDGFHLKYQCSDMGDVGALLVVNQEVISVEGVDSLELLDSVVAEHRAQKIIRR